MALLKLKRPVVRDGEGGWDWLADPEGSGGADMGCWSC
jgi:hypothetical protein